MASFFILFCLNLLSLCSLLIWHRYRAHLLQGQCEMISVLTNINTLPDPINKLLFVSRLALSQINLATARPLQIYWGEKSVGVCCVCEGSVSLGSIQEDVCLREPESLCFSSLQLINKHINLDLIWFFWLVATTSFFVSLLVTVKYSIGSEWTVFIIYYIFCISHSP